MAKIYLSKIALLGCAAGTILGLGACSSGGQLSMGRGLSLGAAVADDGGSGSGSGSGGAGGSTTGGGATTPAGGGGSGGGTNGMNTGGRADAGPVGTLERVGDTVGALGGGAVVVAGNAVLTGQSGLGALLVNTGHALTDNGLGGLPVVGGAVDTVTRTADGGLNGVAKVTLVNETVVGSSSSTSSQLVGVSALSNATTRGQAATVGLLNGGAATQVASLNVGGAQLLGGSGPATVGASLLSPTQPAGTAVTLGVLSGGASPVASVTPLLVPVTNTVGGLVQTLTGTATAPLGGLGLVAGAGAGGAATLGPVTAAGGVLGGLGVGLIGR